MIQLNNVNSIHFSWRPWDQSIINDYSSADQSINQTIMNELGHASTIQHTEMIGMCHINQSNNQSHHWRTPVMQQTIEIEDSHPITIIHIRYAWLFDWLIHICLHTFIRFRSWIVFHSIEIPSAYQSTQTSIKQSINLQYFWWYVHSLRFSSIFWLILNHCYLVDDWRSD